MAKSYVTSYYRFRRDSNYEYVCHFKFCIQLWFLLQIRDVQIRLIFITFYLILFCLSISLSGIAERMHLVDNYNNNIGFLFLTVYMISDLALAPCIPWHMMGKAGKEQKLLSSQLGKTEKRSDESNFIWVFLSCLINKCILFDS